MEKEFVPYELSVKLKELRFDEPCLSYSITNTDASERTWTSVIVAPLYQQVFRWFREKYSISGEVGINCMEDDDYCYEIGDIKTRTTVAEDSFNTHEEAQLACLQKLIEIVESKSE